MYPKRSSSRVQKDSKKNQERNSSSDKEAFQPKPRGRRRGATLTKSKAGNSKVNTGKRDWDIIDIINNTHEAKEDEGRLAAVTDKGLDETDEECVSVNSSVASGPSLLHQPTPSPEWCSACQKLYVKAKRMKTQIKNKLLDNGEYQTV